MGFGVGFALLGIAKPFSLYLVVMVLVGIFMPILATAETVLIQEIVEPSMMGRVFSIVELIAGFSMPFGILLFGPLADIVSIESLLIVSGILLVFVGLSIKGATVVWLQQQLQVDSNAHLGSACGVG